MNMINMNIGILLDMCGIFYTEEQLMKLEKLIENFIQKLVGPKNYEIVENSEIQTDDDQNEDFKEESEDQGYRNRYNPIDCGRNFFLCFFEKCP